MKTTSCTGIETVEYDEADTEDITIETPVASDCDREAQLRAVWEGIRAESWWCLGCPHDGGTNVCRAPGFMKCHGVLAHLLGKQAS